VRVPDVGLALRSVAARFRDRFDPLVVGITGSLAKTSTKEQVAEVLGERFVTLRNPANWNNEIGLPMTLLRLRPEHEVAVLEMGLYTTGEIALLASLARPSIGVVTAVRGVHLSRAGSIEAIETGKRELVEALPADGWAVLNADDQRVRRMAAHTPAQVITYGFAADADVRADNVVSLGTEGMRFTLHLAGGTYEVRTPVLGRHGVHNALAAVAVADRSGMDVAEIITGLARPLHMPHRSQLLRAGAWTVLDDSYNASPDAVLAALGLLAELPGRHVAVLGEMLELGDGAASEHLRVGAAAAALVDRLIVVGEGARGIADGAVEGGLDPSAVQLVAERDEALSLLLAELREGDTVLVKASRGAALDLLVEQLVLAAGAGAVEA
jgi:UDP-N-acetylmuramoyl-tripeptide--D-alanyl-D-alanine ligase